MLNSRYVFYCGREGIGSKESLSIVVPVNIHLQTCQVNGTELPK